MTTFSQLIDSVILDTVRPDMLAQTVGYCSMTIRELHSDPNSGAVLTFTENMLEDRLTANTDDGFSWAIPAPAQFQAIESIFYPIIGKYAPLKKPSSAFLGQDGIDPTLYYYRSGSYVIFSGYGGSGADILMSWFEYPRGLVYYPPGATRLVTWSEEDQEFSYDASLVTVEQKAAALAKSTNWMLQRYTNLVSQGTRGKVWARLGDSEKGKLAYSMYQAWRPAMIAAETYERGIRTNR